MNTYAFICTREKSPTVTRNKLTHYLSRAGIQIKLLVGQDSIFSAYQKAFKITDPHPLDTIILCHDDIEIISDIEIFKTSLETHLSQPKAGFAGVAGGFGNKISISTNMSVAADYNVILWTSNANPSFTVNAGGNYTIKSGADVVIKNMNSI